MGFTLCWLLIVFIVGVAVYIGTRELDFAGWWTFSIVCLALFVHLWIWADSYYDYVDTRTFYDATREQYANSVQMYHDYAEIDVEGASRIVFNDLKYEGYQGNMADFIKKLRREVVDYNEELISKRLMDKTWFWNWLIIAPDDDMKVIKMTSKAPGAAEGL